MSLATNWGYNLTGEITALPDLISTEEFATYTANKYAGDTRIASEIKAASQAIRNYCGWHIYPSEACEMTEFSHFAILRDLIILFPSILLHI